MNNNYNPSDMVSLTSIYWNRFIELNSGYRYSDYDVWQFGHDSETADSLLELVINEIKTATTSAFEMYEQEEILPKKGNISIITNSRGQPGCIVQTTRVVIKKFSEITVSEAAMEGEGDLSLDYWKKIHIQFFSKEYKSRNMDFSIEIPVVFEEFKLIFR